MKTFFCHLVLCIVLFGLAACGGATPPITPTVSPAPSVVPTASFTPTPSPSPTLTVEPAPSLPPEFAAQFDQDSYTVVQNADGVWVARNNADGLDLMTYDSAAKKWQLPELFSGLPLTVAEFPKIADSDPLIALLVQKDRALAEADGFFPDDATEAKVGLAAGGLILGCDKGASPCIKDMETFSRDVTTDNGIVTQFFIIRAIKVPVTEKTPTGVVVWACFLGENPFGDHIAYDPDYELSIAKHRNGRLQMFIRTGRSSATSETSFEPWFDNPDFAAEMEKMDQEMAIWNLDWPIATWIVDPDTR
ncbi:MAG: hypothetical protein FD146_841 [Anaerolineaceae bacterium]|nr:MAG: hypothetical protein FD146_841 [Anaerolineaceae bacterium]